MTTALLLAAGKATRLGALRNQYAKACVPVAGTTPLRFAIERLAQAGVTRVIVNLHWQAEQVRAEARAAVPSGIQLDFLEEDVLLGTGGTVLACLDQFGVLPGVVMNAKQFSDLDLPAVLRAPAGSLVLHSGSPLSQFGGLAYSATNHLLGLLGRDHPPQLPELAVGAAVYTGVCRIDPAWLPHLTDAAPHARADHRPLCLARCGFLAAAEAGATVPVFLHNGVWCEISTPERVQEAEAIVQALAGARSDQRGFGVA